MHKSDDGWFGKLTIGILVLVVAILGNGYSEQLDDKEMKQLKDTISQYETLGRKVNSAESELKNTVLFREMEKVYRDENLSALFTKTKGKWQAQSKEVAWLKKTQKDNPWWIASEVETRIKKLQKAMGVIAGELKKPQTELFRIKSQIDTLIRSNAVATTLSNLEDRWSRLKTQAARQKNDHKDKTGKIDNMLRPYNGKFAKLRQYNAFIEASLRLKYKMDYRKFKTIKASFDRLAKEISTSLTSNSNSLNSLDASYSKILSDQRAEFKIRFGYSTWDDHAEWDNTKNGFTGWVTINGDEDFYGLADAKDLIGKCYRKRTGFLSSSNVCDQYVKNVWTYLKKGHPVRGNTTTEFWAEQVSGKFWHKYTVEKDGKTTETGWVSVSEKFYWDNYKNLGMALETKPIGSFDTETVKEPTPPGLNYVGNPNYGSYDSGGNWVFLPMFFGNYGGYGYNTYDYDDYSNHRRDRDRKTAGGGYVASSNGYYGRNNGFGTEGQRTYKGGGKNLSQGAMTRGSRNFGSNGRGRGASGGGK